MGGTTGISEYNECYGSPGLTGVIEGVLEWIIGKNPFSHEKLSAELYARTRQAHGGIAQQAIAAVENALVYLGKEVREKGFSALKTNIFLFVEQPHMHQPGFARSEGWPALNPERRIINS